MVLQKRLDYGFHGYQVPPTPRAARSARKRCLFKRKPDNRQMCAFDLLATVAGKMLSGRPSANTSSVGKKEVKDENNQLEEKPCNEVCYERNFLVTELVSSAPNANEIACSQNDVISMPGSVATSSDCLKKVGCAEQLVTDDCKLSLGIFPLVNNVDSPSFKKIKMDFGDMGNFEAGNSWHNQEAWEAKPNVLFSSVDHMNRKDYTMPRGSLPVNRDKVKLGNRDDDEIASDSTRNNAFKLSQLADDRRFHKFLDSMHCKATQDSKGDKHFNANTERSDYVSKNNFKRQRSPRDYPLKKRKLYGCSGSVSNSNEGISSGETRNGTSDGGLGSSLALPGGEFSSISHQVKLKIKSFRVPELFIEIPETATIGSLKRTVMKAAGAFLGGGLCVGVLLQGKKIRDDDKTLFQTGISDEKKMDSIGFTLEPTLPITAPIQPDCLDRMQPENPQPVARYPASSSITQNTCQHPNLDAYPDRSLNNLMESDHDSAPVPLRKLNRSESAQRRIRRPFTVAEVEALVQAVEKLGTGRWRDVKLRAFDSAKHRTYVDLKDKWKTLVHTAGISPHQRRGEPVPQELLDRVLAAHDYWSKQQFRSSRDAGLLL